MPELPFQLPERLRAVLGREVEPGRCQCQPSFDADTLAVDASACPFDGQLERHVACRRTVIDALADRDAETVRTTSGGVERAYEGEAAALLVAAGRFVETVAFHDERLARRACEDPLGACREATGRADVVANIAAETGLAELTAQADGYESALAPAVGPTLSHWRVATAPPAGGKLTAVESLPTGATVHRYDRPEGPDHYQLEPAEHSLTAEELSVLADAYHRLAGGTFDGGDRAAARAVREAVETQPERASVSDQQVETITQVLRKHASGYGLLEDFFADTAVSDVYVTAPAASNRVRVTVDGETAVTNVTLTDDGVAALASRFRRESGRPFSRADPTLDATATLGGRQVRIAGVTDPPSAGEAFAFRAQGREVWTLPALVGNETVTPAAAALCSVAVERGGTLLVAGPRGAGKTTMLGALLWELPPTVRTVVIEDTPELPVSALQGAGRDVQALLASAEGTLSPTEALRTALRLGDGALVVGEVRGEEAAVLYEAMRVGASSEAVLGTIHGDGGHSVYERVVTDLGVPPTSFGATDLVISLESTTRGVRRVSRIEEVVGDETTFATLYERRADGLRSTGRVGRGESRLLERLAAPEESYADVRTCLERRRRLLEGLAAREATSGAEVISSHADRQR